MSWWNAKYKNNHGEYEITFASQSKEKTKAVEKICQAVIDMRVKSREDVEAVVRCKDCKHYGGVVFGYTCRLHSGPNTRIQMQENDFCSRGERRTNEMPTLQRE